jgi:predicted PurR-regulated permease PerM
MPTQISLTRHNIFVVAFFIILIGLLSLLFSLLEPFLGSFVWATILVMVFYPLYSHLLKWTRGQATFSSLLCTLLVLVFLALPGFFIVVSLGKEIPKAYTFLSSAQWDDKSLWLMEKLKGLNMETWFQTWGMDSNQTNIILQKEIATALQNISDLILKKVSFLLSNLALFILQLFFVAVALFFFFRDGSRLAIKALEFLPMEKEHQQKVSRTFSKTVTAVVRAVFICSFLQGILAGLGFVVAGVPVPILLALIAFVNSFIPFLGAASVWIPASIWLFYQGQTLAAAGLILWGILITILDHILRPWLIGSEAKLPIFWLFFTTIGGLKVYGFLGIFLGPIILSLGIAFLAIYREVYLNASKPKVTKRLRA